MKRINWIILFGIVLLNGCIYADKEIMGVVGGEGLKQCSTVECFVEAANECEETILELSEDIGAVEYYTQLDSSGFCILNKKIIKVSDNEDPVVKRMLEGKNLLCAYQKGKFNERWVSSLIYDIENCEGELKESIGQLIVLSS